MNNFSLTLIGLFFASSCFSQTDIEKDILNKILEQNISKYKFYIGCQKPKTFFDNTNFNTKTGLEVPSNILEELQLSSNKSNEGIWKLDFPFESKYISQLLNSENCVDKKEIVHLFENDNKRQKVYLISEPLFDFKMENCVVSFLCLSYKGSGFGHSFFLKKVYESWIVIAVFDSWYS